MMKSPFNPIWTEPTSFLVDVESIHTISSFRWEWMKAIWLAAAMFKYFPLQVSSLRQKTCCSPHVHERKTLSDPSTVATLLRLVESALTLADEQRLWTLSIHLDQALIALDGAGRMPPQATQIELGGPPNHAPHLH